MKAFNKIFALAVAVIITVLLQRMWYFLRIAPAADHIL